MARHSVPVHEWRRPARQYVSPPVAALALTVLAVHWCYQDRKRLGLATLGAIALGAQIGRALLLPEGPTPPLLPPLRSRLPWPSGPLPFHLPPLPVDAVLGRAATRSPVRGDAI